MSRSPRINGVALRQGIIDESDFEVENQTKSAHQLFEELSKVHIVEDAVVAHGDYCLPNIIFQEKSITGAIDLGRFGIADRHQDIALFLRSFKVNVGPPDIQLFLDSYGLIDEIDDQKVSFFKMLDEFF